MSRFLPLLIFFSALALLLPASAQEKTKKFRTVRILFLNAPQNAPATAHLHDGSASQPVDLPRMNLSVPYKVPEGPLKLHLLAQTVEDPKQIPAKAPTALIPETMGDAYLLCLSDPSNAIVPLSMEVVDAGKEKFRDGQMMWFNLTPHAVGGILGKEKVALKPHARALVNAPVDGADGYPASISYMIKGDNRVHPICETRWLHDPRSRHLVFVFTEPGRRLPRILGFADYRPPPPPEKKPEETP